MFIFSFCISVCLYYWQLNLAKYSKEYQTIFLQIAQFRIFFCRIRGDKFLPIIQHNVLKSRMSHLLLLNNSMTKVNVTVNVSPASYGIFRLALHVSLAFEHLHSLGFSEKDVDDVKGIFADTNLYLLSATVLIASFHVSDYFITCTFIKFFIKFIQMLKNKFAIFF